MVRWYDSKQAAWGATLMLLAIGGAFSYLKPVVGIPVLVVFFVVGVYLLWRAYTKQRIMTISEQKEGNVETPSIEMHVQKDRIGGDIHLVEVKNNGGRADFDAEIRILEGDPRVFKGSRYPAYWEKSGTHKTVLGKDQWDRVKIGGVDRDIGPVTSYSNRLYFYDVQHSGLSYIDSCYSWGHDTIGADKPLWIIELVITSDPPMKEPLIKHYEFELFEFKEITA